MIVSKPVIRAVGVRGGIRDAGVLPLRDARLVVVKVPGTGAVVPSALPAVVVGGGSGLVWERRCAIVIWQRGLGARRVAALAVGRDYVCGLWGGGAAVAGLRGGGCRW